jgi:predicted ArsR family transcriptional regulator
LETANEPKTAPTPKKSKSTRKAKHTKARKAGGRRDQVLALLRRPNGVMLDDLAMKMSWQRHTVRAFISVLGKDFKIQSFKTERRERGYRVK